MLPTFWKRLHHGGAYNTTSGNGCQAFFRSLFVFLKETLEKHKKSVKWKLFARFLHFAFCYPPAFPGKKHGFGIFFMVSRTGFFVKPIRGCLRENRDFL